METLIGTIVGAIIAGAAMIINSVFSAKREERKEDRLARRKRLEKDLDELNKLYQDALHILDRVIRKYGFDREDNIEKLYSLEIKLKLTSASEIYNKFTEIESAVSVMARELPTLPEEFVPNFERDEDRHERIENRKKAEKKREKEAEKYLKDIHSKYKELSKLMQQDLDKRKKLEL